jgi:hypothetical protein
VADELGPFSKLLANADIDDYELVNETDELIEARFAGLRHVSQYTPDEFVVRQVWRAAFCINEGGFEYLFHERYNGDHDFQLTAGAFKTIGLMRCYEVLQEALALCGPIDPEAGIVHPQYVAATTWNQRRELDSRYFEKDPNDEIEKRLAAFIRANADKLRHLDDPPATHP